jgi:hypothetical protein
MEEVLATYARPADPARPVVCYDEACKELHGHAEPPAAAAPGRPAREDCRYERRGVGHLLLLVCPQTGWRALTVAPRRTKAEFARAMRALVDEHFPQAAKVTVVLDNLNTHTKGALYEAFPAAEARRIAERLEFVYPPVHASWLNMAELEFSVLARQCLGRRIASAEELRREVGAWEEERNERAVEVRWRFTTADARIKLHRLYPSLQ